jgi:5-deoxy-5-amino-3-dehydroquinate synthase
MNTVTVELETRYDVRIGVGVRRELATLIRERAPRAKLAAIVTSSAISEQPWNDLTTGIDTIVITVPDGELAKTPATVAQVVEELAAAGLSRHDVVVGVGGGATTDLAGFAASIYLRGVAVVHVSTTVAGQVDAAIGGKTGVNLATGKNLMGTFHQPIGVLCDLEALNTLPARDLTAGAAEIAKCWMLESRPVTELAGESQLSLTTMAVALKARVVATDEREGGLRATLNYGHTLAHAMEKIALARGEDLRHGEAVAVGLAYAARLAVRMGRVEAPYVDYVSEVLAHFGLASSLSDSYDTDALVAAMRHDKKSHHDLTFVLPSVEGFATVPSVEETLVREVIAAMKGH